ncbi:MAG: NmrA family NAD(P)-binding protein [Burkholderiales bacterium]|nr:NmrA family NAD(P)-binding protein [Burkholderiales bacterium]
MPSTVLILGAAGRIGQVIALAFANAGWKVRAQARKALPNALQGHARVQPVTCDATDVAALTAAAQGASVLVNALNPVYTEWDRLALPLADVALAVGRASGALLMLPGNVYNFGRELPALLTPTTPEVGNTPKARIRIEMERRLAAAATDGVDSVVIRAGDFFGGPGRGTWLDMALLTKVGKGRFVYPGADDVAHAWAYLPDLAQAFVRVAEHREQLRGHHRLHFTGHTLTGQAMREALEQVVGKPLRPAGMPWALIRLLAPFMPMWRELLVMRYLWQRPHALDDADLRALIGPVPQTPLSQALRQVLVELELPVGAGKVPAHA